ncbi:cytochrome c [Duganella sp. LX20W]|uniref:Cytochrome c n=1 Tax=Rugamonas brunnea TaxID=2758569 RepID=A0A7W2ENJ1_9BURK|nr:cytochrome c [Rugamonas brunnea]MBA5635615.1 cytochrome c [Rugamonas brunnea]
MRSIPISIQRGLMPLLFAAAAAPRPALADGAQRPDLDSPATIAAGAKRFNQNCVYCHGNAGSGGKGAALQGRHDLTPEYLFQTISNGKTRGSLLMPAWKEAFSEQEIWELGSYILSLRDVGTKK